MAPDELMRRAIKVAKTGIEAGQTPFGCAIARGDQLLSATHNTVWATTDITAHAEINALRSACQAAGEVLLEGSVAATTCEPCPMCMSALHWARVETVYYGATIGDAQQAGFNELNLPAAKLLADGASGVRLVTGILAEECRELFEQWLTRPDRSVY